MSLGIKKEDLSNEAMITDMYQNDRFRLTKTVKDKTWNNQFTIGQESELQTEAGETFKVWVYFSLLTVLAFYFSTVQPDLLWFLPDHCHSERRETEDSVS